MYGGLASAVVLVFFSPVVSGKVLPDGSNGSLFPLGVDFSWFPLENPGLLSIPLGFFFGWLGTVLSKDSDAEARYAELEVRSLTGSGAEAAVRH
jgi:cation/acetate symporter